MRETRLSGSEGGAGQLNAPSLPLSPDRWLRGRQRIDVAGACRPGGCGTSLSFTPSRPYDDSQGSRSRGIFFIQFVSEGAGDGMRVVGCRGGAPQLHLTDGSAECSGSM
jgi:hypothetical protein